MKKTGSILFLIAGILFFLTAGISFLGEAIGNVSGVWMGIVWLALGVTYIFLAMESARRKEK